MAVQINVQASQAALVSSIQAGVNAYNQKFANQNQLNLKINASGFSQPLGRITGNVKDFEAALAASNARVIAFGASTAVLGGVIRGFKELANVTIEIEKSLTDINRVFGLSTAQLQKFSSSLFDVSKQTSSSFNDAAQAALEFSRQGLKVEEVLKRTNDALLLSKIAGMSTAASIETLTASVNGFKESGITTTQLLNKLVAVEQNYAVSAGDLAEALSRTGQAAQEAGVGIDELNALVTSAQEKTARGGAVIGNALKTIFTRLQRSDTLDQLEQFNIAVRDIQGNMLPAMTILQNFAGVYRSLADSQKAQLSEQVAGVNQINILKAIIGDLSDKQSVYSRAVVDGANATNEASVAAAKLNQTLDALLSQTATVGQQFANNIGKVTFAPLAKEALGTFKSMFEGLNEVLEGEGLGSTFAIGFLKGIKNIIAGPGSIAAFYVLFQLIKNSFAYVVQALPQIAGITTETQNRKNIESAILQIMQEQGMLSRALAGNMGNEAAQAQLLLNAARARTAQMQQELALAQSLARTLAGQGVVVKSTGGLTATRSGGYIPASTQVAEIAGAQAGGYQPGRVVRSPVGGVMNTAETVKYVPGFAQPFINPPASSKAGMMHRQNSIAKTGVDPYANMGFVPNFAKEIPIKNLPKNNVKSSGSLTYLYDFDEPTDLYIEPELGVKRYSLPFTAEQYDRIAQKYIDKVLTNTNKEIKSIADLKYRGVEISKYLSDKFDEKTLSKKDPASIRSNLNNIKGALGEIDTYKYYKSQAEKLTQQFGSDFEIKSEEKLIGLTETKTNKNLVSDNVVIAKALTYLGRKGNYKNNDKTDKISFPFELALLQAKGLKTSDSGFIPNFARRNPPGWNVWSEEQKNAYKERLAQEIQTKDLAKSSQTITSNPSQSLKLQEFNKQQVAKADIARFLKYGYKTIKIPFIDSNIAQGRILKYEDFIIDPKTGKEFPNPSVEFGDRYERFVEPMLRGMFPGYLTSVEAKLFGAAGRTSKQSTSRVDGIRFDDPTNSLDLFEIKAGKPENLDYAEINKKFIEALIGAPQALIQRAKDRQINKYLILNALAAKGFIPNFAYKQSVMNLEQNLSGNKAIFDTQPFPHIRNASQPTFASAIADHGGLNNALSDSMRNQKAAGLMSKGFVPNFATLDVQQSLGKSFGSLTQQQQTEFLSLNKALSQLARNINLTSQQQQILANTVKTNANSLQASTGSTRIVNDANKALAISINQNKNAQQKAAQQTAAMAASATQQTIASGKGGFQNLLNSPIVTMLLPTVTSAIASEFAYGGKQRYELTENQRMKQNFANTGITSITSGAFLGNQILPGWGAAIGGAVGGLIALTSALNAAELSAEELAEVDRNAIEMMQKNAQAGLEYSQKQQELSRIISSGAKQSEIDMAAKAVTSSFLEIKDVKLAEALNATKGNIEGMSKALQQYNLNLQKRQAVTAALSSLRSETFFETSAEKGVKDPKEVASNLYAFFGQQKYGLGTLKASLMSYGKFSQEYRAPDTKSDFDELINRSIQDLIEMSMPDLKKGSSEYKTQFKRFEDLLRGANRKEILDEIEKFENLDDEQKKDLIERIKKEGNLYETRIQIQNAILKNISEANIELKNMEFGQKLIDLTSAFQESLMSSFIDPLQQVSIKRKIALARQDTENKSEVKKINIDFYKNTYSDLSKQLKNETFIKEKIQPAFEKFRTTGDISSVLALRENIKSINEPEALKAFDEAVLKYKLAIDEQKNNNDGQISLIERQFQLEGVKENNNEILNNILEKQITIAGQRERSELIRKTKAELDIDALERQMSDESRYLGKGVIGKTAEKNLIRSEISRKKIAEEEIQKLMSGQTGYEEIINARRKALLEQASAEDAMTMGGGMFARVEQESIQTVQIKNAEDLAKAIQQTQDITFTNTEQEQRRLTTLENLKKIQEEIAQGKLKETEITKRLNEEEMRNAERRTSFKYGVKQGIDEMLDNADTLGNRLGKEIPTQFADGMTNALMEVAKGTKTIGDAFKDMAINFGQMIMQEVMRAMIQRAVGTALGSVPFLKQKGGMIHAQNGMYISGGRTGDKNPAMLEDGEYVLNRNAVAALGGPSVLDSLNFKQVPRFGKGPGMQGGGQFSMEGLYAYDKNKELNPSGQVAAGGTNLGNINYDDFTAYSYIESDYFKKIREKAISDEQERVQKAYQSKLKTAQLVGSLVGLVGSAFMAKGLGQLGKTGGVKKGIDVPASPNSAFSGLGATPLVQRGGLMHFNSGGFVPYGSRLSDTIPALLTGGEYVMNNSAVRKYGLGTMNMMNSGSYDNSNSNTVNNSTNNHATNISINVDRSGKTEYGANSSSYEKQDIVFSQQMARKINLLVQRSMNDEKRYNGIINRNTLR